MHRRLAILAIFVVLPLLGFLRLFAALLGWV
jgi:hypothetical protein